MKHGNQAKALAGLGCLGWPILIGLALAAITGLLVLAARNPSGAIGLLAGIATLAILAYPVSCIVIGVREDNANP